MAKTAYGLAAALAVAAAVGARAAAPGADAGGEALARDVLARVADLALVPPRLFTAPVPARYRPARERWAMNNGAAVTPGGRLWASWIGGGDSPDAYVVCAVSADGGATWGDPALVVDGHDPANLPFPRSNVIANLWTDPAGRLHLFFSQSICHNDGRMGVWETVCAAPDAARPQWTPPRRLCDGAALNKPVVLRNGDWLLPVELGWTKGPWRGLFESRPDASRASVLASGDGGATWRPRGGVWVADSDWAENNLLELADGRLRMYMRSRKGLRTAESPDGGRTWGDVQKPDGMDQPCARCQVRKLRSGNWIFVKHLSPPDSFNGNRRDGIIAYLSRDEGRTWEGGLVLDARKATSYPDVEQGADGTIYVTHDFERGREAEILLHTFTEADILARRFASPAARQGIVVMKALGTKHNLKAHPATPERNTK